MTMNFSQAHGDHLQPDEPDHGLTAFAQRVFDQIDGAYSKKGHGMHGKDADLDPGGQLVVKSIVVLDPVKRKNLLVRAMVHQYASICAPEDENGDDERTSAMNEFATDIVCDEMRYNGNWTGSDYWSFHHDTIIECECTADEVEENAFEGVAERLVAAIHANQEVSDFIKSMADMANEISALHSMTDEQLGVKR
jgi:hypothetical protein